MKEGENERGLERDGENKRGSKREGEREREGENERGRERGVTMLSVRYKWCQRWDGLP